MVDRRNQILTSAVSSQVMEPDWPIPGHIKALSTTRLGGYSSAPYHAFNLAQHVGDNPCRVSANRRWLVTRYRLPSYPQWLQQVHSTKVVNTESHVTAPPLADGIMTSDFYQVCVVMTADCLPMLFCDDEGEQIAAVHAGWRGLANGIIEQTVKKFVAPAHRLTCWLGPAIGPTAFEVGKDVYNAFPNKEDQHQGFSRIETKTDKWFADLYVLARQRMSRLGLQDCFGGGFCTYSESERFFSFRREGATGRMATLIWKTRPV